MSDNSLLEFFPLCNNQKDDIILNSNIQKLWYNHVEFEKIDFNHHIHISWYDFIEKVCYYHLRTVYLYLLSNTSSSWESYSYFSLFSALSDKY